MKIIGNRLVKKKPVPIIIECTSMEVKGHSGFIEDFDPENCRIFMRTTHPNISYFIIKTDTKKMPNSDLRPYCWLTLAEANKIMKYAEENDVIDLRKFGKYQICSQETNQIVYIRNDINDWNDEDIPLLVQIIGDQKDD